MPSTLSGVGTGAVARGDAPAIVAVARELERIVDRVAALHMRRATAVLEIVDALVAHERVLDAAKVDPDVRHLVGEQRSRVEIFEAVAFLPFVGRSPRRDSFRVRQRMRGRAEPQDVQQQRLVVAFPSPRQKSASGFQPCVTVVAAVLRPCASRRGDTIASAATRISARPAYPRRNTRRRQHAGEQDRAVHGRQFALPRAAPGLHVEKVIIEAVVAGGVRLGALQAVPEKSQRGEDALRSPRRA